MSTDTLAYYLLGMLALTIGGFAVGILIAGRMSRKREAAEQAQERVPSKPASAVDIPEEPVHDTLSALRQLTETSDR
jgi:hypothetical protein